MTASDVMRRCPYCQVRPSYAFLFRRISDPMSAPTTTPYVSRGPVERIFLTYKARITAENRMKRMALWSQIIVAWYSVWITAVSLADISDRYTVRDGGVVTTFLSTAILTASIFLYGQRYEIRGAGFRECYLKLRELYDSNDDVAKVLKVYNDLLPSYENHSRSDYDQILFDAWFSKKPLHDANGEVAISRNVIISYVAKAIGRFVLFFVIMVIPIIIVFYTVSPDK